jgi:hypothetical protein
MRSLVKAHTPYTDAKQDARERYQDLSTALENK